MLRVSFFFLVQREARASILLLVWNKESEANTRPKSHLQPGGWIETQDLHPRIMSDDDSIPAKDTYPPAQFMDLAHIAWAQAGVDCRITPQIGEMMKGAGFVNVTCRQFRVPLGPWPRDE